MRRVLRIIGALGLLMIAAPFALGFPSRASHGQDMLDNFHPLMQQANVDKTAAYYNDVFVPLGAVVPAMSQENVTKFNRDPGSVDVGVVRVGTVLQRSAPPRVVPPRSAHPDGGRRPLTLTAADH